MEKFLPVLLPQAQDAIIILAFIAIDIATGLIKSMACQDYASSTMRVGLFHKLAEIISFLFGIAADLAFPVIGVTLPVSLARSIAVYLVIMESGSIVENIGKTNPDIAAFIGGLFDKIQPGKPDEEKPEEGSENK